MDQPMKAPARTMVAFAVFILAMAAIGQQPATAPANGSSPQAVTTATNDPKDIVRRSVEADHRSWELAQSYTCRQREVEKKLGKKGEAKSTEIKTYDVNFYYGQEYSRLILKDDKPLSDKEQKKEDEKLEKF